MQWRLRGNVQRVVDLWQKSKKVIFAIQNYNFNASFLCFTLFVNFMNDNLQCVVLIKNVITSSCCVIIIRTQVMQPLIPRLPFPSFFQGLQLLRHPQRMPFLYHPFVPYYRKLFQERDSNMSALFKYLYHSDQIPYWTSALNIIRLNIFTLLFFLCLDFFPFLDSL